MDETWKKIVPNSEDTPENVVHKITYHEYHISLSSHMDQGEKLMPFPHTTFHSIADTVKTATRALPGHLCLSWQPRKLMSLSSIVDNK